MTDTLTPERRSWNMSRIRSKNTKPEIIIRSMLHRMGYRFTIDGPLNRILPGHPDIVLPKHHTVVFVHGCFWHRHRSCKMAYMPKSRTTFWLQKFQENVDRDRRAVCNLRRLGWGVVVIWECQTGKKNWISRLTAATKLHFTHQCPTIISSQQ